MHAIVLVLLADLANYRRACHWKQRELRGAMWTDIAFCPQDDENPPDFPVPEGDRAALKAGIVQVMIQLSNSPNLQVQVGEAIAVMAEWDFPLQWGDLVNVRGLCLQDYRE